MITRSDALLERSSKRLVSKNGARWFIASVVSMPSFVSVRLLWTSRRCWRARRAVVALLKLVGQSSDLALYGRSSISAHSLTVTLGLYLLDRGLAALGVRPTTTTSAPHRRQRHRCSLPIPEYRP